MPNRDAEISRLRQALRFYAHKLHFEIHDQLAWDTVSGEPSNFLCDSADTATVENGWIARSALRGEPLDFEEELAPIEGEYGGSPRE